MDPHEESKAELSCISEEHLEGRVKTRKSSIHQIRRASVQSSVELADSL